MNFKILILSGLFLLVAINSVFGQKQICVADFGVKPNRYENASPAVCKALDACKSIKDAILVLPGGRIDLWPEGAVKRELYISNSTENDTLSKVKNIGFLIENFENLTIEGNNTLVVLHGKMISFAILNCKNIKIQNISFDYERPTMSELTISSVSDNSVETVIHPDSKYSIDNGKFCFYGEGWKANSHHTIVFEPDHNIMKYSSFKPFISSHATELSPFHVKFEGDFTNAKLHKGDILTVRDPYRDNCGGFICYSKDIKLENVEMFYMHGLGIVSQFSENITLFKVQAAPRENSGRIISCFADCFHFSGCKGKILIDSCFTSGSHDDPINIHGTHLQITSVESKRKFTVRFMHHQTFGFEAFFKDDSIALVDPLSLQLLAFAKLKNARLINKYEMELEVFENIPLNIKPGLCIENLTWTPEVTISNCRFERTNTRGLLVTTRRKVLIENNTFSKTGMQAILIADDAKSWFESGPVQDVTIRNNTFIECGYNTSPDHFVIAISPENEELIPGVIVHSNIHILNNTFRLYSSSILSARSAGNLDFTGNTIISVYDLLTGPVGPAFMLTSCKQVNIEKNLFQSYEQPYIQQCKMNKGELKTDLNTTF